MSDHTNVKDVTATVVSGSNYAYGRVKEYLGDGVYASFDGYQVWLEAQEGNQIALEYAVWLAVVQYGQKVYQVQAATPESETK